MWQVSSIAGSLFLSAPAVAVEYYLVYWEDEGSVTAVPCSSVDCGVVGQRHTVKLGKDKFTGKLMYSGKFCVNPAV